MTLMEAVGAGLALVGFDARYGNPTFIKDGENGYLVTYSETMDEDLLVSQMADKIVFALESDLESMHQASYELAKTVFETCNSRGLEKALDSHTISVLKKALSL